MSLLDLVFGKKKKKGLSKTSQKKSNEVDEHYTLSVSVTVEKVPQYAPGYVRPSTPDYTGYVPTKKICRYKVKGTNPETNRRKTVKNVYAGSWGLYPETVPGIDPPYEYILDDEKITDPQAGVFERNHVPIPLGITKNDAIVVIMHIICDSSDEPHPFFEPQLPDNMLEEAVRKQLYLPSYISQEEARNFLDGKKWRIDDFD